MPALDTYLRKQARQDARKRLAAPFVMTLNGNLVGYYTLSSFAVELDEFPEALACKLPGYEVIPATLIGRLARDERVRGQGIGRKLLMNALKRSLDQSRIIASFAVVVDAKDDHAREFYVRYGFTPVNTEPMRLFLPMGTVAKLF